MKPPELSDFSHIRYELKAACVSYFFPFYLFPFYLVKPALSRKKRKYHQTFFKVEQKVH